MNSKTNSKQLQKRRSFTIEILIFLAIMLSAQALTAQDTTPPSVVSVSPDYDATGVLTGTEVVITFDEDVQLTSNPDKQLEIRRSSNNSLVTSVGGGAVAIVGNEATIDFGVLPSSQLVYVLVSASVFEDLAGNGWNESFIAKEWEFTTDDGPDYTTLEPADNASNINPGTHLRITFDEIVNWADGSINVYEDDLTSTPPLVESFSSTTNASRVSGIGTTELTIDLTSVLQANTSYLVRFDQAVQDANGNVNQDFSLSDWNFTTGNEDVSAPFLSATTPSDEATNVDALTHLVATFSEDVQAGAGSIEVRQQSDGQLLQSVTVSSANVSFDRDEVTIDLPSTLPEGVNVYVAIASGVIEDLSGNDFAGLPTSEFWDFTTEGSSDAIAPSISSLSPADDAVEVAVDGSLVITFDEDVLPTTGSNAFIRYAAGAIVELISLEGAGATFSDNTLTLNPSNDLPYDAGLYVDIPSGAIEDLAGNDFTGITDNTTWNFSTESAPDVTAPAVISFSPTDDATDVAVDGSLTITFDEDVQPVSGGVASVKYSAGTTVASVALSGSGATFSGNTLTLDFSIDLPYDANLYVAIPAGGIEDLAGNDFAGITNNTTWNFSTESAPDVTGPTVTSFSPTDDATDVAIDAMFTLTFDEEVQPGPGGVIYFKYVTGANASFSILNGSDATFSGNTVTFTPSLDLPYERDLYVWIASGAIKDLAGNDFGGITASTTWNFTTKAEFVTWNGSSWNNGSGPASNDDVQINGTYTGDFECTNLTVNIGATFNVDGTLDVQNNLINNGDLIVFSGSSLLTYDDEGTKDAVTILRATRYGDGKYSMVGTPVAQSASITGVDLGPIVYGYDESQPYGINDGLDRWIDVSTDQLVPGHGYAQAGKQHLSFSGIPNDGSIHVTGSYTEDTDDANEGWNLVANPYPAAISVADFLSDNTNIAGAVYIWDDNGSDTGRGSNADYIVANGTMATNTTPAGGQARYNQHLGATQGFFVKLIDDKNTDIVFHEEHRVTGSNADDHFFRKVTMPIARINLTDEQGLFKQTVVGLTEEATTTALNSTYDAQAFSAAADYGVYTLKAGRSLALNGMPESWEAVQLQFNVAAAGSYTLGLELEDFSGALFLRDNQTGAVIDLRNASYAFHAEGGIHTDRFELLASNEPVLGVPNQEVLIYAYDDVLHINQTDQEPRFYQVFNLKGHRVLTKEVRSNAEIDVSLLAKGIYLVFDGSRTHKVLLK